MSFFVWLKDIDSGDGGVVNGLVFDDDEQCMLSLWWCENRNEEEVKKMGNELCVRASTTGVSFSCCIGGGAAMVFGSCR